VEREAGGVDAKQVREGRAGYGRARGEGRNARRGGRQGRVRRAGRARAWPRRGRGDGTGRWRAQAGWGVVLGVAWPSGIAGHQCRRPLPRHRTGEGEGEERRKREKGERRADRWAHSHVASTSAKPHSKPPGWPNVTGFESWMVKATRFWSWMAKIKLGQELDGQK